MIAHELVELLECHAPRFTSDVVRDLVTNERTPAFHALDSSELEQRIFQMVNQLGNWIGDPQAEMVHAEFAEWGHRRFKQGIPLSEIMYAVVILKQHMRRYFLDHGLVDRAVPRVDGDYVLPMHLHALQDLNARLGRFFDEALYHLACGYEAEAKRVPVAARGSAHRW